MIKEQVSNKNVFTIKLPAGNELVYTLNNSKQIEICTNAQVQEELDNNTITSINFGNLTIKVGDDFKHEQVLTPSSYHIIEIVKKEHRKFKNSYLLTTHKDTLTSTYILPCLAMTKQQVGYNGFLINAYLTKEADKLALLYRYNLSEDYGRLEKGLLGSKLFINIDNSIQGFDLVYMSISKCFSKDVILFTQGGYSKLSKELKEMIVNFHGLTKKDHVYKVMYKEPDLMKKLEKEFGLSSAHFVELDKKSDLNLEIL